MSQRKRGNRNNNRRTGLISMIDDNGTRVFVTPNELGKSSRTTRFHGQTVGGKQVASMAANIGKIDTVIGNSDRFGQNMTVPTSDIEVFAVGLARQFGYTVTAPAAVHG